MNDFKFAVFEGKGFLCAPDEFFEYLDDLEYTNSIDIAELMEVLDDWIEE
jgi:hypothetical protein